MADIKCSMGKAVNFSKSIRNSEFYFWNPLCSSPVTDVSLISFLTYRTKIRIILVE